MPRKPGEKNLSADVDPELYDQWLTFLSDHPHKEPTQRQCVTAAMELFMALPDELKGILLLCERKSEFFKRVAAVAAQAVTTVAFPGDESETSPPIPPEQLEAMGGRPVDRSIAAAKVRGGKRRESKKATG